MLTFVATCFLSVLVAGFTIWYAYLNVYCTTLCLGSSKTFGVMFNHNGAQAWYGSVYKVRLRNNTLFVWNTDATDEPDVVLTRVSNLEMHRNHPTCSQWPKQTIIYVAAYENQLREAAEARDKWLKEEGQRLEKEFGKYLESGWSSGRDVLRLLDWLEDRQYSSGKLEAIKRDLRDSARFFDPDSGVLLRFDGEETRQHYLRSREELMVALRTYYPEIVGR